jgi:hypothetical protein
MTEIPIVGKRAQGLIHLLHAIIEDSPDAIIFHQVYSSKTKCALAGTLCWIPGFMGLAMLPVRCAGCIVGCVSLNDCIKGATASTLLSVSPCMASTPTRWIVPVFDHDYEYVVARYKTEFQSKRNSDNIRELVRRTMCAISEASCEAPPAWARDCITSVIHAPTE